MTFVRQSCAFTGRYLRQLMRQPAYIFITLVQPVIWLLLFGALFRRITDIPGFGGGNYINFLTPGVVIMTALFSAGWVGMSFIDDMELGVMDRFLTSPARRGAMITGSLAYQAVVTVIQSVIIVVLGVLTGATLGGGVAGAGVLIAVGVLVALAFAALSNGLALVARNRDTLIAAASSIVLPLTFLSTAFLGEALITPWIRDIARFNPVNWAIKAGRGAMAVDTAWATVGSYTGFLVLTVIACAVISTRAFRSYQRSI